MVLKLKGPSAGVDYKHQHLNQTETSAHCKYTHYIVNKWLFLSTKGWRRGHTS